jgi:carbonic anhydrase
MSVAPFSLRPLMLVLSLAVAGSPVMASDDHAPAPKRSEAKAEKAEAKAEKAEAKAEPKTEAKAEPKGEAKPKTAPPLPDPMDRLRERLAEKLGNAKAAEPVKPNVLRVVSHGTESRSPAPSQGGGGGAASRSAARLAAEHRAATNPNGRDLSRLPGLQPQPLHAAHWGYGGAEGPEAWGSMKPEFATCSNGARQSPIDIRDGIKVQLDPVQFDYRPSSFNVVDNGHTIQVNVGQGNSIEVLGRRYELVQFHFHRPSEERINGRQFDMVAHLVHKDLDGRLAVVAVLLDRGSAHPIVQSVWNNLPLEKGDAVAARTALDMNALLPADRSYFTYMGSLTTPPCSEGVLWMVMKNPVGISQDQIAIFSRLYPMNARPIQSASGRMIKESN